IFVGGIASFGLVTMVQGNPFLIIEYLDPALGIMDGSLLPDIPVWNAIVAVIGRKVNISHFLNFSSFIVFQLIGYTRQFFKILSFNALKELDTAGFLTLEQKVIITLQKYADLFVEIFQREESHLPQRIIDPLINQMY